MADRDNPRCLPCANEHKRKWTPETIVAAMQRWARAKGRQPAATDWLVPLGGEYPPVTSVQHVFGSWNAAIEAAGFEPRKVGYYGRDGEDPAVVQETVELYRQGLTMVEVGQRLGITGSGVLSRLIKAGEPRRAAGPRPM